MRYELLIIKLHEEKSYRASPNVESNFFEPTSQMTCRIQLVGSCFMANSRCHYCYTILTSLIFPKIASNNKVTMEQNGSNGSMPIN